MDADTHRQDHPAPGRRGFLRQAGLAALVVGCLDLVGVSRAKASTTTTTTEKRPSVPASKNVGAIYPRTGKPRPDTLASQDCSCGITWYPSPGNCGAGRTDSASCYFWYDSCTGEYGGPVHAWSDGAPHTQCT
jgi:hypothetical protein